MGKRGPKPKPTALRVFEGTRIQRPTDRTTEPVPLADSIPDPPPCLGVHGKAEWEKITPILYSVGCLTDADESLFIQYCSAWDDFYSALKDMKENGLFYETEHGSRQQNPALKLKYTAAALIVKIGGMFGMAPASRVGLSSAVQDVGHDDLERFKSEVG